MILRSVISSLSALPLLAQSLVPVAFSAGDTGDVRLAIGEAPHQIIVNSEEALDLLERLIAQACTDEPGKIGARVLLASCLVAGPAVDDPLRQCRSMGYGDDIQSLQRLVDRGSLRDVNSFSVVYESLKTLRQVPRVVMEHPGVPKDWLSLGRGVEVYVDLRSHKHVESVIAIPERDVAVHLLKTTREAMWQLVSRQINVAGANASPAVMTQMQAALEVPFLVAWECRRLLGELSVEVIVVNDIGDHLEITCRSRADVKEWRAKLERLSFEAVVVDEACVARRGVVKLNVIPYRPGDGAATASGSKTFSLHAWSNSSALSGFGGFLRSSITSEIGGGPVVAPPVQEWVGEINQVEGATEGTSGPLPASPLVWMGRLAAKAAFAAIR